MNIINDSDQENLNHRKIVYNKFKIIREQNEGTITFEFIKNIIQKKNKNPNIFLIILLIIISIQIIFIIIFICIILLFCTSLKEEDINNKFLDQIKFYIKSNKNDHERVQNQSQIQNISDKKDQHQIKNESQILGKIYNENLTKNRPLNSLPYNSNLKICLHAFGKMENSIAKDFVEWHKRIGINKIYIYL